MSSIVWSSIGKKLINAVTGLGLVVFIIVHLAGNLILLSGNADAFNEYSHFYEKIGSLLYVIEFGLVVFFVFHIITGTTVWLSKLNGRPDGYDQSGNAGGPSKKTISSRTMIWTGIVLLVFTVIHVMTFKYGPGMAEGYRTVIDGVAMRDLYRWVVEVFQKPGYVIWYVVSMFLLGFHLRHGFWSAFQSLGANHPRCSPILYSLGLFIGVVVAVGFMALPIVIYIRGM